MPSTQRSVALLGATGSIGTQTLDVLRREPEAFELVSVSAHQRVEDLAATVNEFHVRRVGVASDADVARLRTLVAHDVDVVVGPSGLAELASEADIVVNAVMGLPDCRSRCRP